MDARIDDKALDSIRGWFYISDRELFAWLLDRQHERGIDGNVVEVGCYLGKSAVAIGAHVHAGETFTVLDLFEGPAGDAANSSEMAGSYSALTRSQFEANYLRFHGALPHVVQGPSSEITDHVEAGSVRFMHVDASHLYQHVRGDIEAARRLLTANGIVVFDDYRSEHTPGVAAAVWEAVVSDGLVPLWITPSKLYAAWQPAPDLLADLAGWLTQQGPRAWFEYQDVARHRLMRVKVLRPAPVAPTQEPNVGTSVPVGGTSSVPPPATASASGRPAATQAADPPNAPLQPSPSRMRTLAKEVTPPILARRLHRLRKRWQANRP